MLVLRYIFQDVFEGWSITKKILFKEHHKTARMKLNCPK